MWLVFSIEFPTRSNRELSGRKREIVEAHRETNPHAKKWFRWFGRGLNPASKINENLVSSLLRWRFKSWVEFVQNPTKPELRRIVWNRSHRGMEYQPRPVGASRKKSDRGFGLSNSGFRVNPCYSTLTSGLEQTSWPLLDNSMHIPAPHQMSHRIAIRRRLRPPGTQGATAACRGHNFFSADGGY